MKSVIAALCLLFLIAAAVQVGLADGFVAAVVFALAATMFFGFVTGIADALTKPFRRPRVD